MRKPQPGSADRNARTKRNPTSKEHERRQTRAGLGARRLAVSLIEAVLDRRTTLDDVLADMAQREIATALEPRDRAFARLIATTVLRRLGSLDHVLGSFLDKPLPKEASRVRVILLAAAAQLLCIGTPAHAAIDLAVEQCRRDRHARRFDKLANAVLRRVASEGAAIIGRLDAPRIDVPDWLWRRWSRAYGDATARRIAEASLREAPLDLSVKSDAAGWAEKLGGRVLQTGSVRLVAGGRIEDLAGYQDGQWWVQDAAAALPARLLGAVAGLRVADLCAAPGGKTAQLASAGARVVAVDVSAGRLQVLRENVTRLRLADRVDIIEADIETWAPADRFDAILLDAPCTATGTLRRHPDILRLKIDEDVTRLAATQARLLARAANLLLPGGTLVYCTCSLQPDEGERQIDRFLEQRKDFERIHVRAEEIGGAQDWIAPTGDLRTLPFQLALEPPALSGIDGFYAARLRRIV